MSQVLLPIVLGLCCGVAYVMFGAVIFVQWEHEWTILDAAYFTFITLTTIGFGDLVPSASKLKTHQTETTLVVKLLFTALYCLLGEYLLLLFTFFR